MCRAAAVLVVACVAALVACGTIPFADLEAELAQAEQEWAARNVTHYEMQVYHITYMYEVTAKLEVRDGAATVLSCKVGLTFAKQRADQCKSLSGDWFTIPELFETAKVMIRDAQLSPHAYAEPPPIHITFDPTYRFPTHLVSRLAESTQTTISAFKVLP